MEKTAELLRKIYDDLDRAADVVVGRRPLTSEDPYWWLSGEVIRDWNVKRQPGGPKVMRPYNRKFYRDEDPSRDQRYPEVECFPVKPSAFFRSVDRTIATTVDKLIRLGYPIPKCLHRERYSELIHEAESWEELRFHVREAKIKEDVPENAYHDGKWFEENMGISEDNLRQAQKRKKLPNTKKEGKKNLYLVADVRAWRRDKVREKCVTT